MLCHCNFYSFFSLQGSGKFSKSPDDEKEQVRRGSQQATSGSFRPTEDNAQPPNEKGRWLSHIIRFFSKK